MELKSSVSPILLWGKHERGSGPRPDLTHGAGSVQRGCRRSEPVSGEECPLRARQRPAGAGAQLPSGVCVLGVAQPGRGSAKEGGSEATGA